MDPIAEIRARLRKYPGSRCEEGDGWIRYLPDSDDGFAVELHRDDEEYVVAFEGWHGHFADVESALDCFAFGLSDRCRLRIHSKGGSPHKWIVESLQNGEWVTESVTGLMVFAFWRPSRIDYRQNALIRTADAP